MFLDFVSLQKLVSNTCKLFFLCNNRSGKPTYFSAVFNTHSPAIKQSWISNLQMAKLALGTLHCLFLNYLLCMTVSMFNMTFIIRAASESESFTVRYLECFTLQSTSQSVMTQWVTLFVPFFQMRTIYRAGSLLRMMGIRSKSRSILSYFDRCLWSCQNYKNLRSDCCTSPKSASFSPHVMAG